MTERYDREKFVTMFGAASDGIDEKYKAITYQLFQRIADAGLSLCFGGGSTGLMGAAAKGYKSSEKNTFLLGVAPKWMSEFEPIFSQCDDLILTNDMEERKQILRNTSKVYILCPGGQGTIEEWALCSVSRQLERIPDDSRIIMFNCDGFYDDFIKFLRKCDREGFISSKSMETTIVCNSVDEVMDTIKTLYHL